MLEHTDGTAKCSLCTFKKVHADYGAAVAAAPLGLPPILRTPDMPLLLPMHPSLGVSCHVRNGLLGMPAASASAAAPGVPAWLEKAQRAFYSRGWCDIETVSFSRVVLPQKHLKEIGNLMKREAKTIFQTIGAGRLSHAGDAKRRQLSADDMMRLPGLTTTEMDAVASLRELYEDCGAALVRVLGSTVKFSLSAAGTLISLPGATPQQGHCDYIVNDEFCKHWRDSCASPASAVITFPDAPASLEIWDGAVPLVMELAAAGGLDSQITDKGLVSEMFPLKESSMRIFSGFLPHAGAGNAAADAHVRGHLYADLCPLLFGDQVGRVPDSIMALADINRKQGSGDFFVSVNGPPAASRKK